jgi:hypothetical protein
MNGVGGTAAAGPRRAGGIDLVALPNRSAIQVPVLRPSAPAREECVDDAHALSAAAGAASSRRWTLLAGCRIPPSRRGPGFAPSPGSAAGGTPVRAEGPAGGATCAGRREYESAPADTIPLPARRAVHAYRQLRDAFGQRVSGIGSDGRNRSEDRRHPWAGHILDTMTAETSSPLPASTPRRSRAALTEAYRADGDEEPARLEFETAKAAFEPRRHPRREANEPDARRSGGVRSAGWNPWPG